MIGARAFIAMSCSLVILSAWVSDSEPPNTVKSLAKTKVLRPLTVPQPVTTPSPGILDFSMPKFHGAVFDEHVEFLERPLVEQQLDALAGGQLALAVLRLDALLAAAQFGACTTRFEGVQDVFHVLQPVNVTCYRPRRPQGLGEVLAWGFRRWKRPSGRVESPKIAWRRRRSCLYPGQTRESAGWPIS
jgi:hypothetical protein